MQTKYGERPGLTVDGGAVNADGVDMSGFMAVLHDAGADECGNVTVSSGLWSRIKCEHYAALAEIAGLRRRKFTPVPTDGEGWIMHSVPAQVADYAAALVSERDAARAEAARLRALCDALAVALGHFHEQHPNDLNGMCAMSDWASLRATEAGKDGAR